jgi:DNA-binding NarL/FixJ family response regulator
MIRVLLADDHGLVRTGLSSLLGTAADIEIVGEAADGARQSPWSRRPVPTSC